MVRCPNCARWAMHGRRSDSVAVTVPSIVLPRSDNIIVNPAHPDFPKNQSCRPVGFDFDPRLAN